MKLVDSLWESLCVTAMASVHAILNSQPAAIVLPLCNSGQTPLIKELQY